MERPYRSPEEIADLINNHHYYENNVGALEAYIMTNFTVAEMSVFAKFLRGEDCTPHDPEWHRDTSGYIKLSWMNHDALVYFFDSIVRDCYIYMGAASVLKYGTNLFPAAVVTNLNLLDLTLYELTRLVPAEYRKQLDAASRLDDIKGLVEASKAQGDRIEGKVGETDEKISILELSNRKNLERSNDFLAIMPDKEELGELRKAVRKHLDEKKRPRISNETAARIFKTFYPDPQHTYATLTGHTVGNWLERGEMPKYPNFKINEAALASKMSFLQWLVANCNDIGLQISMSGNVNDMLKDL